MFIKNYSNFLFILVFSPFFRFYSNFREACTRIIREVIQDFSRAISPGKNVYLFQAEKSNEASIAFSTSSGKAEKKS